MQPACGEELFDAVEAAAREAPDEVGLRLVEDLQGNARELSRARILELARRGAAGLRAAGLRPGDRLLLDLPTGEEILAALLGAFHLGAWPASVAPLRHRRGGAAEAEWGALLERLQPGLVVSLDPPPAEGVPFLPAGELLAADPAEAGPRAPAAEVAYVQFSSGSTGTPKALQLGLPGVVANIRGMERHIPLHADDHIVSWLPLYHDMGLFGTLLIALHRRCTLTLFDPSLFARNPLLWLRVVGDSGCTITVGPPSAYRATLEFQRRRPLDGLDLSRCTRWLCGAEQVTPALVRRFADELVPLGAPADGLKPVYGMSEITLAATMPPVGRGPRLHTHDGLEWTAVGVPLAGQRMRVVDAAGEELPPERVGRVLLASPSLYSHVLDRGEAAPREGEWLDTGDLGFVHDGELFITGRTREVIIKGGRNYSPERVEELATRTDGVDRAAAFGVFDPRRETERAVLVAEVHPRLLGDAAGRDALRLALRGGLAEAGYEIDEVALAARGTLPRTTSGKLRRGAAREAYERGDFAPAPAEEGA